MVRGVIDVNSFELSVRSFFRTFLTFRLSHYNGIYTGCLQFLYNKGAQLPALLLTVFYGITVMNTTI